jgi:broad specificity phosphatase PhoE
MDLVMIYLVRHGCHSLLNRVLCARLRDVPLSEEGVQQARWLAVQFATRPIDLVQSSPRKRSRQTAEPIARRHALEIECAEDFDEIDMGEWSGRSFESLVHDPLWLYWNKRRGSARPPNGESMAELQARVLAHLHRLLAQRLKAVIVTHAEPIRAVLLHYLKRPLDRYAEIDIAPGSVSILRSSRDGVEVLQQNLAGLA